MKKDYKQVLRSEEFIFTGIVFLVVLLLLLSIIGLPYKARTFPVVVCAFTLVLLAMQLANIFRKAGAASKEGITKRIPWKVPAGFGILLAAVGVGYLGGLHFGAGFLGGSLCWLYGERRWWVILLVAIGGFALMYFLYGRLFMLPMKF